MATSKSERVGAARPRPGGRSARIVGDVLEATLKELIEVGYAEFSLESVAQRAGVHKTTVYRRWGTRESLLIAALLQRIGERVPIPDTGSLRSDLLEFVGKIVEVSRSTEDVALIRTFTSAAGRNAGLDRVASEFWQARVELAREIVGRAVERGELPEQTEPQLLIEAVFGPVYLRFLITGEPLTEEFLEQVVDLALNGVRQGPR